MLLKLELLHDNNTIPMATRPAVTVFVLKTLVIFDLSLPIAKSTAPRKISAWPEVNLRDQSTPICGFK
ncbi:hypothetical protein EBR21_10955 [bacterium]|nr:hypothetical protein [bacterium]